MKFLGLVVFVAVAAGNVFHEPFSQLTKHSWKTMSTPAYQPFLINKGYYHYPIQPKECEEHQDYYSYYDYFPYFPFATDLPQGIFSGQQRSPAKKNDRHQSVQGWQRNPTESKGLNPRFRWNQKFFLIDNEAQTVQALRPFNPLEMLNYQFSQIKPSSPITRPIFAKRTMTMTITETISTTDTRICIPPNLFTAASNPTLCPMISRMNRLSKSYDLLEDENILPSPASLVVPTVLTSQSPRSPVDALESSKDEVLNEERDLGYYDYEELTRKDRAMFGSPSLVTVIVLSTHTDFVTRAVSPLFSMSGAQTGLLICVPPGLAVCV